LYLPIGGYFLSDDFGMFRARARVELFRPPGREKGIPLSGAGDFFDAEKVTKKAPGGHPRIPPIFGRMLIFSPVLETALRSLPFGAKSISPNFGCRPLDAVTN